MDNLSDMEKKLLADAKDKNIRINPIHTRVLTLEKLKRDGFIKLVNIGMTEYEYAITDNGRAKLSD